MNKFILKYVKTDKLWKLLPASHNHVRQQQGMLIVVGLNQFRHSSSSPLLDTIASAKSMKSSTDVVLFYKEKH